MTPYYEDEWCAIWHADCREVSAWLVDDVLITDPPYGRAWRQGNIKGHANSEASDGIANDHDTSTRDAALHLWGDKPAIVFGDLMLSPPAGTQLTAVYHKASGSEGLRGAIAGIRRDCEAIYLMNGWASGLGGRSSVFATHRQISGSQGIVARNGGGHPHTKPIDVMSALISLTAPEASIADPFMGSGSTLVAAKLLGRRCIGVEVDEAYCEIAAKRLAQGVLDFGGAA